MDLDAVRGLSQPDQRSCGPSTVVAAHLLLDPAFRPASFAEEVLARHRKLTAPVAFGHAQLPWPRALGTPPWAIARAVAVYAGRPYRTRVLRWGSRVDDLETVRTAVAEGLPCPLYVGSATLPRHVVLAVATAGDGLQLWNPNHGRLVEVTGAAFRSGDLAGLGRWRRPWFAVVPA